MDGYARRMWGFNNVDKVIPVKYGVFRTRFLNKEARDRALEMTNLLLDSFPIFIRQWEEGINLEALTFDKVPIWVRTYELPLKYWGSLNKLMYAIGDPIKADNATAKRNRIQYARYLVEMNNNEEFSASLMFKNEDGMIVQYPIEYEWRPIK